MRSWSKGAGGACIALGLTLIGFLTASSAHAATGVLDPSLFRADPNDPSTRWLRALFPSLIDSSAQHDAFGEILGTLNACLLALAAAYVMYSVVVGTMNTAHDGEVLGKKWSSLWVPVRVVSGMALMVPLPSGYVTAQLLVMKIALAGVGLANTTWDRALVVLVDRGTAIAQVQPPATDEFVAGLFQVLTCEALLNEFLDPSGNSRAGNTAEPAVVREVTRIDAKGKLTSSIERTGFGTSSANSAPIASVSFIWAPSTGRGTAPVCGSVTLLRYVVTEAAQQPAAPPPPADGPVLGTVQSRYRANQAAWIRESTPGLAEMNYLPVVQAANVRVVDEAGHAREWLNLLNQADTSLKEVAQHIARVIVNRSDMNAMEPLQYTQAAQHLGLMRDWLMSSAYASARSAWARAQDRAPAQLEEAMRAGGWSSAGSFLAEVSSVQAQILRLAASVPSTTAPTREEGSSTEAKALREALMQVDSITRKAGLQTLSTAVRQTVSTDGAAGPGKEDPAARFVPGGLDAKLSEVFANIAMAASGERWVNPVASLSALGHSIIRVVFVSLGLAFAGGSFLSGIANIFTAGGAGQMLNMLSFPLGMMVITVVTAGAFLAYVLPMIPWLVFLMGVVGWLILVIEAVVAAPLWAMAWLRFDGEGMIGEAAHTGVRILLSLLLRPFLMLVGLLLGFSLFLIVAGIINAQLLTAAHLALGDETAGLVGWVVIAVLAAAVNVKMMERCVALTHILPDQILRWIGGHVEQSHSEGDSSKVIGTAVGGINKIESYTSQQLSRKNNSGGGASGKSRKK